MTKTAMLHKGNDDSSSSEDEVAKDALKEATDHEFFKGTHFSVELPSSSNISENACKSEDVKDIKGSLKTKSLRRSSNRNDQFESFGVTPSFQNFVAKKLNELLERSIKLKHKNKDQLSINGEKLADNDFGIKLLNTSLEYLTTEEEIIQKIRPKKLRKSEEITEENANFLKCKEVAVNAEWILSKADTKAWTNKRKEPDFKYKKLQNGVLIEET